MLACATDPLLARTASAPHEAVNHATAAGREPRQGKRRAEGRELPGKQHDALSSPEGRRHELIGEGIHGCLVCTGMAVPCTVVPVTRMAVPSYEGFTTVSPTSDIVS